MTYTKFTQTPSSEAIILGIDPGYSRLGYAVLKKTPREEKLLAYSCLDFPSSEEYQQKILKIGQNIEKLIQQYKPNILAIEKVYFAKNQKTALRVSEVKGLVTHLALKNKMSVVEYTPLQVKVAVCGYGQAPKEQVKKMVNILIKLPRQPKHDDTIDAVALCLTCSARNDHKIFI